MNKVIKSLESKGVKFEGYSDFGKLISDFDSYSKKSDNLFAFLIENNLNRFLFGLIIRLGILDIDNFSFREKTLDPNFIQNSIKESFIKKFECPDCQNLLFREHEDNIENDKVIIKKCYYCDKSYKIKFKNLQDDFNINRNDLIKFLNRLFDIDVVDRELYYICPNCHRKEKINEIIKLECECGVLREIKNLYLFKDEFFKSCLRNKDGKWFEWYVYKICQHVYYRTDHNILISCNKTSKPWKCEIDVASIDEEGKLIIFESKDYLKSKVTFKEMENLDKLSTICEDTNFVSSSKKVSTRIKADVESYCPTKINFIEGVKLEKQYLSEDRVLEVFSKRGINKGIFLYRKLNDRKKINIMKIIISKIISSEAQKPKCLRILTKLMYAINNFEDIINHDINNLKITLNYSIANIKNDNLVSYSVEYIEAVFHVSKKLILDVLDVNEIIQLGTKYLTPIPTDGYKQRAPFYHLFTSLFLSSEINLNKLDKEILQDFILKYIPMLSIYWGYYSRENTLGVFKNLWKFTSPNSKERLKNECKKVLNDPKTTTGSKMLLNNFLNKYLQDD